MSNNETTLTRFSRDNLRDTAFYETYRHLIKSHPPAAGVLNRVAARVGDEIVLPGSHTPFLVESWTEAAPWIDEIQAHVGTNSPQFLITGLQAALHPLAQALSLDVTVAGVIWDITAAEDWVAWHEQHPGEPEIVAPNGRVAGATDSDRVALERWALGPVFTDNIEATAGWPKKVAFA